MGIFVPTIQEMENVMFISKKELNEIKSQIIRLQNEVSALTTFRHLTEANMSHMINEVNSKLFQMKAAKTPAILSKPAPKKRGRPAGSKNKPKRVTK